MQFDKIEAEDTIRMIISNKIKNLNDFPTGWDGRVISILSPNILNTAHIHRFDLYKIAKEEKEKFINATK